MPASRALLLRMVAAALSLGLLAGGAPIRVMAFAEAVPCAQSASPDSGRAVLGRQCGLKAAAWRAREAPRAKAPGHPDPASGPLAGQGGSAAPLPVTGVERETWYFAEGSSYRNDRETLSFVNPGPRTALVLTTLIRFDGRKVSAVTDVGPRSRGTLDAGFAAGAGDLLAVVVRSSEPIVAERTVYHGDPEDEGTGAALTTGIAATAHSWYLPRLSISADDQERIAILNPYPFAITAHVAYVRKGVLRTPMAVTVPPIGVVGLKVPDGATSAIVSSAADSGGLVVEERTTYGKGRGYSVLAGITKPMTDMYVPQPAAGDGHDYLMTLNPGHLPAVLTLHAQGNRSGQIRRLSVPAHGQLLVQLKATDIGNNSALRIQSTSPVAISYLGVLPPSAEPSLAKIYRGSVVTNPVAPARTHVFAEGDTRLLLSNPRETLVLANTTGRAARVTVTMIATAGRTSARSLVVNGGGSVRLAVNGWGPAAQHGLIVIADQPIVAMRVIDFNEAADRIESTGAIE